MSSFQIIEKGIWQLNTTKTTLTFDGPQSSFTLDIVSLSENELRVSQLAKGARYVMA
ncbi:MAG: hypothetical protein ACJAY8_001503 [Sphingobacteriales bacterium]|jgi:hypothetical protein